MAVNVVVDPFGRDDVFALELEKRSTAYRRHPQLYKTAGYDREPQPYVVLGDSRAAALRNKYFSGTRFPGFFNMAFGGGTLPEAFSAFWHAAERRDLKGVVLGVPLRMFSARYKQGKNQFLEAQRWLDSPFRYYSSMDVFKTGIDILEKHLPDSLAGTVSDVRSFTIADFMKAEAAARSDAAERKWRRQIDIAARSDWRRFEFNEAYFAEIERIAAYSKANDIRLIFFIPPTPVEMQRRIEDFGRTGINFTYRKRLAKLAPVVDFDFYSPWTGDEENFRDAFHFGSTFARQISAELIRFFEPSTKTVKTIAKRRNGVYCPTAVNDPAADVFRGEVTLLTGESCRVWIASDKEQSR